eukprot:SAG11_NODE_1310_length_5236_cov_2.603270_3_plen_96_part_00
MRRACCWMFTVHMLLQRGVIVRLRRLMFAPVYSQVSELRRRIVASRELTAERLLPCVSSLVASEVALRTAGIPATLLRISTAKQQTTLRRASCKM